YPFDIAEAEVELASGILVELSGRALALYLYSIYLKRYISSMLTAVVVFTLMPLNPLVRFILVNASIPFIWILYSITSVMLGRSRIDLAPGTLFKVYIVLLTISITGLLVIK
ncbi:MAG: NADH-quinone oxidoreductase subunit H, partial [Desulfurococcus sp.]|uniref:NADH-quinone oxidoreductase subunit H n=1 Tax=Desulfurococcus sp. TaxID=51678 RepID=UPI00315FB0E6